MQTTDVEYIVHPLQAENINLLASLILSTIPPNVHGELKEFLTYFCDNTPMNYNLE